MRVNFAFLVLRVYLIRSYCSEILALKNSVALLKNFIPFGSQVEFLAQIAHVKQFFVVLLQKTV